jgi:hypothetical protein
MGDDFLRTLQVFGIELESNLEIDQLKSKTMGRGHSKLPWGCCTVYLGAGITQWEVTE